VRGLKSGLIASVGVCLILPGALPASASARERLALSATLRGTHSRGVIRRHRGSHEGVYPAQPSGRSSIVGGDPAAQGTWPFMAFVVYYDATGSPVFWCSGTVISSNVVLTAGHCGIDEATGTARDPSGYRVVTASVDWTDSSRREISSVSRLIVEPYYDPTTKRDDAALLVLSTPTTAPGIRLAATTEQVLTAPGTPAYIAGWGQTYSGSSTPQNLQWASTVIQGAPYCAQAIAAFDAASQLCGVDYPYDLMGTCNGDSGGPLVAAASDGTPVEVGITSYGPTDCNTSSPDGFTRADQIASWANAWAAAEAPPAPAPSAPSGPPPAAPPLPSMRLSDARSYVRQTLVGVFGRTFRRGHQYSARCHRRSAASFRCDVAWWYGPNDYYGQVAIYFVTGSASDVEWANRYAISWVNDRCYWHSHHPQRCAKRKVRGSW
jgi:secreted trypsin-like serine protease